MPLHKIAIYSFFLILILISSGTKAGIFGTSNQSECMLDKLPGTENNIAARVIIRYCRDNYSDQFVKEKSPFFGVKTEAECIIEYSKETSSRIAANWIRGACQKLYPR